MAAKGKEEAARPATKRKLVRPSSCTRLRAARPAAASLAHKTGREIVGVTLFGSAAERLSAYGPRLDWLVHAASTAADVLDSAERSRLVVFGPHPSQTACALETLGLLRLGGYAGRVLFLVPLDPDEMVGHALCVEARDRGANVVQSQSTSDTALALLAAELSGSRARLPALGPVLSHADLRIEGNVAYRSARKLELTQGELLLLRLFMENVGTAFSSDQIAAYISGGVRSPDTPKKYVSTLRQKIGDVAHDLIRRNAIGWGIGI